MILESIKEYLNIHNWNEMFNMFWEIHDTDLIQHFFYIPLNIQIEICVLEEKITCIILFSPNYIFT